MIMLADRVFKVVKMCRHEEEFCDYICYLKNQDNKTITSDPENPAIKWEFMRYPHKFLKAFLENQDEKDFRETVEQAWRQQQDMLLIHKGERANPLFLSVNSERSVAQLRKEWSTSYAKEHGLLVIMD